MIEIEDRTQIKKENIKWYDLYRSGFYKYITDLSEEDLKEMIFGEIENDNCC